MSYVFVVDTNKKPLNPVHPGEARFLLKAGKAAVLKRYPFTLVLKRALERPVVQPVRLKLDPGSKTTGIAVVNDQSGKVVFAADRAHRGQVIHAALLSRRAVRRSRRARHTRYRKPRFDNRRRKPGWLAPSLQSRVDTVLTWVQRLRRVCPIEAISMELVRFDLQAMEQPDILGCQYQQGTLAGYELREYLLEKWQRRCAYCAKEHLPLQVEHIVPRAKGGSNRVSNLTLACEQCNCAKGTQDVAVFLKGKPAVLTRILAQAKTPLKDAAAVNSTRWTLFERLNVLGLPLECGSGGLTKFNRTIRNLEKAHWVDAACVGRRTPTELAIQGIVPLRIKATGQGSCQMCRMDRYGFPRTGPKQAKCVKGFQTGDIVRCVVRSGVKVGTYVGKVAVRSTGSFNITTPTRTVQGMSHRFCTVLHHCDGYSYHMGTGERSADRLSFLHCR
jgi:5-methylcytosine-specific restriction endonuclease McrA